MALHAAAAPSCLTRLRQHGARARQELLLDHKSILQPTCRIAVPPLWLLTHRRHLPLRSPTPAPPHAVIFTRGLPPLPGFDPVRHIRDCQPLPA